MNKFKILFHICLVFVLSLIAMSCQDKHDELIDDIQIDNSETGGNHNLTRAEIQRLVKDCVSASATYSDYTWYIHMESTLEQKLPGHAIEYGVGHGVVDGSINVSIGEKAYKYNQYSSGNKEIIDIGSPFFFYFMFGTPYYGEEEQKMAGESDFYIRSYYALKEKGLSKLTIDEKELYKSLVEILDEYESWAKYNYRPSAQVIVDDYFVTVAEFRLK